MKTTLGSQPHNMPLASQAHDVMHRTRTMEEASTATHPHHYHHHHYHHRSAGASKGSSAFNYTMHDCYEKLKQLVPTIPKNKKITRVEILQHVIDYIQDLQSALESHNINVCSSSSSRVSGNTHLQVPGAGVNRRPFTSLTPQQNLDMLNGLADLENYDWQRTLLNLTSAARGTKLHPYETPESSPESLPTCTS